MEIRSALAVPAHRSSQACLHLARLECLRGDLRRIGCAGAVFYDPINIRYATGTSNMQVYALHNPDAGPACDG